MPREGFASPTLPISIYEIAKQQASIEGISVAELIGKAIRRYVDIRQEKEETVKLVLEALDKIEKKNKEG